MSHNWQRNSTYKVNSLDTERQEAPEEEEEWAGAEAAEGMYIDEKGNTRPLYSSMSSYAVARLKLHASVLSTCKVDADIPAGCMLVFVLLGERARVLV